MFINKEGYLNIIFINVSPLLWDIIIFGIVTGFFIGGRALTFISAGNLLSIGCKYPTLIMLPVLSTKYLILIFLLLFSIEKLLRTCLESF